MMMISVAICSSSLIFSGSLRPMRLDDRVRARRGWQNPVNMSVGSPTDSIALYCDLRDQRVPQKELDRLMAQTVGSLEEKNMLLQEKNMLLQEKISQGLAGTLHERCTRNSALCLHAIALPAFTR